MPYLSFVFKERTDGWMERRKKGRNMRKAKVTTKERPAICKIMCSVTELH
jgi:hypothetical protein